VPRHHYRHNDRRRDDGDDDGSIGDDDDDDDDDIVVVPDVTHTLQRTFAELLSDGARAPASSRGASLSESATTIAETRIDRHRRHRHDRWWMNYVTNEEGVDDDDDDEEGMMIEESTSSAEAVVVDPRFFWNELPALSLLPPPKKTPSSPSSLTSTMSATSSLHSLSSPSSPYRCLLDHVIPVTSAFVGVQRGIAIPSSPSSATDADRNGVDHPNTSLERYDQILISRRSRYRAGTRFTRRGVDGAGNVANYAETEQICFVVSGGRDGDNCESVHGRGDGRLGVVDRDDVIGDGSVGGDDNKYGNTTSSNNNKEHNNRVLEVYSHVQTRGSIPLHWSSPVFNVMTYRPRVYIGVDPMAQARGLRDHLLGELRRYSAPSHSSSKLPSSNPPSSSLSGGAGEVKSTKSTSEKNAIMMDYSSLKRKMTKQIAMVNLIDKHSDQGRLGRAFDSVLDAVLDVYNGGHGPTLPPTLGLRPDSIEHVWFDFHAECKGGRYDHLSQLLELVVPTLNDQGYFCAVLSTATRENESIIASSSAKTPPHRMEDENAINPRSSWAVRSLQDGVVRTNCMDCLDRTNVVQSMFGRYMIYKHIYERMGRLSQRRRTLPLECVVAYKRRPLTLLWTDGEGPTTTSGTTL
jgi:hypothetical protein